MGLINCLNIKYLHMNCNITCNIKDITKEKKINLKLKVDKKYCFDKDINYKSYIKT